MQAKTADVFQPPAEAMAEAPTATAKLTEQSQTASASEMEQSPEEEQSTAEAKVFEIPAALGVPQESPADEQQPSAEPDGGEKSLVAKASLTEQPGDKSGPISDAKAAEPLQASESSQPQFAAEANGVEVPQLATIPTMQQLVDKAVSTAEAKVAEAPGVLEVPQEETVDESQPAAARGAEWSQASMAPKMEQPNVEAEPAGVAKAVKGQQPLETPQEKSVEDQLPVVEATSAEESRTAEFPTIEQAVDEVPATAEGKVSEVPQPAGVPQEQLVDQPRSAAEDMVSEVSQAPETSKETEKSKAAAFVEIPSTVEASAAEDLPRFEEPFQKPFVFELAQARVAQAPQPVGALTGGQSLEEHPVDEPQPAAKPNEAEALQAATPNDEAEPAAEAMVAEVAHVPEAMRSKPADGFQPGAEAMGLAAEFPHMEKPADQPDPTAETNPTTVLQRPATLEEKLADEPQLAAGAGRADAPELAEEPKDAEPIVAPSSTTAATMREEPRSAEAPHKQGPVDEAETAIEDTAGEVPKAPAAPLEKAVDEPQPTATAKLAEESQTAGLPKIGQTLEEDESAAEAKVFEMPVALGVLQESPADEQHPSTKTPAAEAPLIEQPGDDSEPNSDAKGVEVPQLAQNRTMEQLVGKLVSTVEAKVVELPQPPEASQEETVDVSQSAAAAKDAEWSQAIVVQKLEQPVAEVEPTVDAKAVEGPQPQKVPQEKADDDQQPVAEATSTQGSQTAELPTFEQLVDEADKAEGKVAEVPQIAGVPHEQIVDQLRSAAEDMVAEEPQAPEMPKAMEKSKAAASVEIPSTLEARAAEDLPIFEEPFQKPLVFELAEAKVTQEPESVETLIGGQNLEANSPSAQISTRRRASTQVEALLWTNRIEKLKYLAIVTTLMFGIAAGELNNYSPTDWPLWPGLAYLFSVCLALVDSFYCSLICVLVVSAAQRVQIREGDKLHSNDLEVIAACSMLSPEDVIKKWESGVPYHVQITRAMVNKHHSPLGVGLSIFPASCYLCTLAISYRVMKDADVIARIILLVSVAVPGFVAVFFARRLMIVLVS